MSFPLNLGWFVIALTKREGIKDATPVPDLEFKDHARWRSPCCEKFKPGPRRSPVGVKLHIERGQGAQRCHPCEWSNYLLSKWFCSSCSSWKYVDLRRTAKLTLTVFLSHNIDKEENKKIQSAKPSGWGIGFIKLSVFRYTLLLSRKLPS